MPAPQSTISLPTSETQLEPQSQEVDAICPSHGQYVMTVRSLDAGFGKPLVTRSPCPDCKVEAEAKAELEKQAQLAEDRRRRVAALMNRAGIPPRFADRSFGTYTAVERGQKIALGICRTYTEKWPEKSGQGASLVLTGMPGTGKTHLAAAIGNAVMEDHLGSVLFCTVSAMLRAIKSTYRKDSERSEQAVIDRLIEPDLLILDEVGVQVGSEHEKLLMFEILNERYQEMRPTILISNLAIDELEEFLGHRVMDRYRECGSVLAFDWQSHRGQR